MASRCPTVHVAVVLAAIGALSGCGGSDAPAERPGVAPAARSPDERRLTALERADRPECRMQRSGSTYVAAGLRVIDPPGENGVQFVKDRDARIPAGARTPDGRLARELSPVLSLGDGDSVGERGEALTPSDPEDVTVVFSPLVPDASARDRRAVLRLAVDQTEAVLRQKGRSVPGGFDVTSSIVGDVARVTSSSRASGRTVRERRIFALTGCSLVQALGWPTQTERVVRAAIRAAS